MDYKHLIFSIISLLILGLFFKKIHTYIDNSENKDNEWRRLRMIEAGEVNGVRFPPGIIIDVNATDGEKLVESKKAEYVDVDKSDENSETE